jgi:hypothetical protein
VVRRRRGTSRLGCLFTLLLLVTVVYFGVNIGEVYLRYYRLRDAMTQEARFARANDDDAIRLRLSALADTLGLPESASHFQIRRTTTHIVISTDYSEHVELPLFVREFHFSPVAEHLF